MSLPSRGSSCRAVISSHPLARGLPCQLVRSLKEVLSSEWECNAHGFLDQDALFAATVCAIMHINVAVHVFHDAPVVVMTNMWPTDVSRLVDLPLRGHAPGPSVPGCCVTSTEALDRVILCFDMVTSRRGIDPQTQNTSSKSRS